MMHDLIGWMGAAACVAAMIWTWKIRGPWKTFRECYEEAAARRRGEPPPVSKLEKTGPLPKNLKIELTLYGPHATIVRATPEARSALTSWLLRLDDPVESGTIALLQGDRFPAGLAARVRKAWGEKRVLLRDVFDVPADLRPIDHLSLRAYQKEAVEAAVTSRRGILRLATAAGKTRIAAALAVRVPIQWLYLVHRQSLAVQTRALLEDLGVTNMDVATYQGLLADRHRATLACYQGVVVDEAHAAGAAGYQAVLERLENASWRIGLGATPLLRPDGLNTRVIGALGPILYDKPALELAAEGFIAAGYVRFVPFLHDRRAAYASARNYADAYETAITQNEARNQLVAAETLRAPAPRIVVVREVAHGLALQRLLGAQGTLFLSGQDDVRVRSWAFQKVREGACTTLVVTSIGEEGIDIPNLRTVVVGSGGKAVIAAVQRLGRGMRLAEGKRGFRLIDIADRGVPWLERHARGRAAAYAQTGLLVDGAPAAAPAEKPADVVTFERGPGVPVAAVEGVGARFLASSYFLVQALFFAPCNRACTERPDVDDPAVEVAPAPETGGATDATDAADATRKTLATQNTSSVTSDTVRSISNPSSGRTIWMRGRGYLLASEAAKELGVHRSTVYRWLAEGRLRGLNQGGAWYVLAADVALLRAAETLASEAKEAPATDDPRVLEAPDEVPEPAQAPLQAPDEIPDDPVPLDGFRP